ncbi:DUF92 domain-containing protein [Candidatus Micrarchaeota archaeon]|nr:DUF92 domain-containing protein [Candidatus Micrarchaeota archaeon]MBI5177523.1 DUF92 domain-containing protein [Candidatus Micrarchaeota archaeon]
MIADLVRFLLATTISLALAVFVFRREALSKSGTMAAVILGVSTYFFGGEAWFLIIAAFFVTSVFFTHFKAKKKAEVVKEFSKGGVRDFWQVLANGGIAGLLALSFFYNRNPIFFYAFLGVIATVTADTWATELGILQNTKPRLITTGQPVRVGTSGAISPGGTAIAAAGALFIGIAAVVFLKLAGSPLVGSAWFSIGLRISAIAMASGLLGALSDSFLGATVQAMYYCTKCRKETETLTHTCGEKTVAIRGFRWFDNDLVNFASSMAGGAIAAGLYYLLV